MKRTAALAAAGILATLALTGCASDDNLRLVLGDEVTLASLPPRVPEPATDADGSPIDRAALESDGPSVHGLDRSSFLPVDFVVPIDGTRHQPEAVSLFRLTDETARQRGEYPTTVSAIEEPSGRSCRVQAVEMAGAPVWAFIEVLILPFELIIDPFFETVASPDELRNRMPDSTAPLVPGILPLTTEELEAIRAERAEMRADG